MPVGPRDRGEPISSPQSPSADTYQLAPVLEASLALQRAGKKIVFTNGVFDLLHPGHVRYLRCARSLGDALVVGVNSDRSVRANKGPGRPITPDHERAELLASLTFVDWVVIFDEDTPHQMIAVLKPEVLVKGDDWPEDNIIGREIVEASGGSVVRVPIQPGYSTSSIIARIRQGVQR